MQSKPKKNSVVTQRVDETAGTFEVTITLPRVLVYEIRNDDGTMHSEIPFDLSRVYQAHHGRATVHGWGQRLPDAAAIGLTDDDGNIIPKAERTAMKADKIGKLVDHYESGTQDWSRKGDGTGTRRSLVIEALARVKNETYESAMERADEFAARKYGGDRKKALAYLATADDVAAAMRAIRDERAQPIAGVNADDLLA